MLKGKNVRSGDAALGMEAPITRRDFLGSTLLASGAMLLGGAAPAELLADRDDFTGYGGRGEYSSSNGNTLDVLSAGHSIRDGIYDPLPKDIVDTGESYDCVIIGGGISGLAAALFFQRQAGPGMKCLLIENHPIFGGEAKQNEFLVEGKRLIAHQGSAIYQVPYPRSFLAGFYRSIGLETPKLEYQKWAGSEPEIPLSRTPYESVGLQHGQYGFWFGTRFSQASGMWLIDPLGKNLEGAPISKESKAEWLRFLKSQPAEKTQFEHPQREEDAISQYLDSITLEQHYMERFGLSRETVRTFLSPVEGGGSGLGPDALSAYSDYAFEMLHPLPEEEGGSDEMFPGGNTTIARLLVKSLIPNSIVGPANVEGVSKNTVNFAALDVPGAAARVRLSSTVIHVQHEGEPNTANSVTVIYAQAGQLHKVKARSVVMAGGGLATRHNVKKFSGEDSNPFAW